MTHSPDNLAALDEFSDAAIEFAAMSRKLALVLAAQEGFAARLQELHGRDYSDDLAKIYARQEEVGTALRALAETPAMRVSLKEVAAGIERASEAVRGKDQQALMQGQAAFIQAAQDMKQVVASARSAVVQKKWLAGAAGGGLLLGMILFAILPGAIARSMPATWLWPEKRATKAMGLDGWQAGDRLMRVSNPDQWDARRQAIALMKTNEEAILKCWKRSLKEKGAVQCSIDVHAPNN
jgi:hypothetical protein